MTTKRAGFASRLRFTERCLFSPDAVTRRLGAGVLVLACLLSFAPCRLRAQKITLAPVITTVAGNGTYGDSGDNGPAASAQFSTPWAVAVDRAGNLYIADYESERIRKVDATGTITTVAGNGIGGYNGDNIAATSAELWYPYGVTVDSAGNLFIAELYSQRIRKVDGSGIITTVAGNGTPGYNGDNIAATSAQLFSPSAVAVDSAGNLYIAEVQNQRIRKVDGSGIITTVAGNGTEGFSGDNGPATNAELTRPIGVTVDSAGNLYLAENETQRVRKVDASGTITTVAGNGTPGYNGDNIAATGAQLSYPTGVAVDSAGSLYIAESYNHRVRKVDASGTITTVAGNGIPGYGGDDGPATSARLSHPSGVAVDSAGKLYIADFASNRIRKVAKGPVDFGQVNVGANSARNVFLSINTDLTLSSVQASGDYSVLSNSCALNTPLSADTICTLQVQFTPTKPGQRWFPLVATDSGSNKYSFGLEGTGVGPALAFTPGIITTVAGNGTPGYSGDNIAATGAELYRCAGVAVDSAGDLYIADAYNHRVRKIDASGAITTVAGNGTSGYSGDNGPADSAELNYPFAVAVDSAGNLYIADTNNSRIRKVDASGTITTVAGNGTYGYSGDNGPATSAELSHHTGVAVDSAGNLFIADFDNSRIRKVDASGTITTVAGNGTPGYSGDNGPATGAQLAYPHRVAVDGAGNLFIADYYNWRIRKVDVSGIITTVAGNGTYGYGGDNGPATSAQLAYPDGVAVDSAGNFYIADYSNSRVRKVDASGTITTMAGNGNLDYSGDNGPATSADLYFPSDVAVGNAGNLYIADSYNSRIRKVDVTASALFFSSESVGQTSGPQSMVLSDVGNAPLNFTQPFTISPNFQLASVGDDCAIGTPLAVGANCNLGALFAPLVPGNPLTGTLTVIDDAFNSPHIVGLSGIAAVGAVDVTIGTSPAGLSFTVDSTSYTSAQNFSWKIGSQHTLATTSPQGSGTRYTFTGWSDAGEISHQVTASAEATSYTGSFSASYLLTTAVNPSGIGTVTPAPGYFAPNAVVPLTATPSPGYLFSSWSGPVASASSATTTVTMSGPESVTANFIPMLGMVPPSISFGTVTLWGGTKQFLIIINNTTAPVKFTKISLGALQNVTAKDLTYDGGCTSSLAPGKTCKITLSLWPSKAGAASAILTLKDNASGSPHQVLITATVIAPKANVSPSSLSFASQTVNTTTAAKTVTLNNPGVGPLTISGITITGSNAADFLLTNNCASPLAQASSCTASVSFKPKAKGSRSATLKFTDNAQSGSQTVSLSGKGN